MLKFLKYIALSALVFLLLTGAAITIYFTVNDANDFKPSIESQAKEQAGIYLKIKGELAWSLLPLGITLGELEVLDQNQKNFASIKELIAEIDLFSLFKLAPKVQTISIDGLALELIQEKDKTPNWANILPASDSKKTETNTSSIKKTNSDSSPDTEKTNKPIDFLVESFSIQNSRVHFFSESDSLDVTLKNIQLAISNIALNQNIPLSLQFDLVNAKPELKLNTHISGQLSISEDMSAFKLHDLTSQYKINSPLLGKNTIQAHSNASIQANTKTETINISQLALGFENLALTGSVNIKEYAKQPDIQGKISLAEFSLKQLLTHLGVELPKMKSPQALNKVSLSTTFKNAHQQLELSKLNIQLDDSHWLGSLGFHTPDQAVKLTLKGDKINIDDYLPPASGKPTEAASKDNKPAKQTQTETASLPQETELLPLKTIRALKLDIQIEQDTLIVKQLETNQVNTRITAQNGLLKLDTFTGKFYQGSYNVKARIDAHTDTPLWSATQSIQGVQLEPIAKIFSELDYIPAGTLNLKAKQNSTGNLLSQITKNAAADSQIEVKDGRIKNISLNAMACEGLALLNKESVNTDQWPKETPFTRLSAEATLKQQKVDSQLSVITSGIKLSGTGKINTQNEHVDFRAGLYVIGDLGEQACRVNDKFKDISIPVRCKGSIGTPPAKLCGLDNTRLEKEIKRAAVKEAKRKANKEIDRALNKQLNKHLGKDNKLKKDIKKLFKGLF